MSAEPSQAAVAVDAMTAAEYDDFVSQLAWAAEEETNLWEIRLFSRFRGWPVPTTDALEAVCTGRTGVFGSQGPTFGMEPL